MTDYLIWPKILTPAECRPNIVPFSRGERTLGGIRRSVRTDLGYWNVELKNIPVNSRRQRQTWQAISESLGGAAGVIAVPVKTFDTAPYVSGEREPPVLTPHDDDSTFDDDAEYEQGAITVVTDGITALGATSIKLRIINAEANMVGVLFSYDHALYKTGPATNVDGNIWTVPITPSVRKLIPAGADLEFDDPTCLCHLAEDRGMDGGLDTTGFEQRSVTFVEAVDLFSGSA